MISNEEKKMRFKINALSDAEAKSTLLIIMHGTNDLSKAIDRAVEINAG